MKNINIPNTLTVLRIILLVPMFIVGLDDPFKGALIAAVLGITDFIDGYIARRFNQVTALGGVLDPISDRLLLITSFILFFMTRSVPNWFLIVIGLRELLVGVGTLLIFIRKIPRPDVNKVGKISAFAAMVATPSWVVVNTHYGIVEKVFLALAIFATCVSIPTGYISLYEYLSVLRPKTKQ